MGGVRKYDADCCPETAVTAKQLRAESYSARRRAVFACNWPTRRCGNVRATFDRHGIHANAFESHAAAFERH